MNSGAEGAEFFLRIKNGQFFFTKYMANDDFPEPPRHADSKTPIFIFCQFLGLGHLWGLGVSLGRILGVPSIEPFLGTGGLAMGLYRPPPPPIESPPTQSTTAGGGGTATDVDSEDFPMHMPQLRNRRMREECNCPADLRRISRQSAGALHPRGQPVRVDGDCLPDVDRGLVLRRGPPAGPGGPPPDTAQVGRGCKAEASGAGPHLTLIPCVLPL